MSTATKGGGKGRWAPKPKAEVGAKEEVNNVTATSNGNKDKTAPTAACDPVHTTTENTTTRTYSKNEGNSIGGEYNANKKREVQGKKSHGRDSTETKKYTKSKSEAPAAAKTVVVQPPKPIEPLMMQDIRMQVISDKFSIGHGAVRVMGEFQGESSQDYGEFEVRGNFSIKWHLRAGEPFS